jgi:RNA polymerase sigma-70 factor (ECF subfamily)
MDNAGCGSSRTSGRAGCPRFPGLKGNPVYLNHPLLRYVVGIVSSRAPSDTDITGWALAAGRGDRAALERFVRHTQRDVWRFVAHLSSVHLADDLTQETYIRALGSLGRFQGRSSARTWLLSIARRAVVDHLRTIRTRPRRADTVDWQTAAERSQPDTPGFDDGVALDQLINALDPDRREAFLLTQTLGLPYADAALVCRCPVGTIRSRVARARDDLITALRDTDQSSGRRPAI